ncbi:MAG: AAA family ATPase [Oscillospiraceae bacterium]
MGRYLNPDNTEFEESVNSEIYIDKSMLIEYTNKVLRTQQKYICVSRPRRFGKSMAANMLTAYYSKDCDSKELFSNLKISESENFEKHLNKYNVIRINMQNFLNKAKSIEQMINLVSLTVGRDIFRKYPDVDYLDKSVLSYVLDDVFEEYKIPFIIIIDEWDCVLRDNRIGDDEQKQYLDFLCDIYKDQRYLALGYMTGILPIKKYGKHSAINVFYEYSMTNAAPISEFTGFTETEVMNICEKYDKSFSEMKRWYDGYRVNDNHIYNPKSVVEAVIRNQFDNYWTSTETYEALKVYIEMNFDGLKDTITELLAGQKAVIDTTTFTNDMVTFSSKDDVLTLLIHLGYLTYDIDTKEVSIPNYEISEQYASTIKVMGWSEVADYACQN